MKMCYISLLTEDQQEFTEQSPSIPTVFLTKRDQQGIMLLYLLKKKHFMFQLMAYTRWAFRLLHTGLDDSQTMWLFSLYKYGFI